MEEFIPSLSAQSSRTKFFTPIKKFKQKTFSTMKKIFKVVYNKRMVPTKSHSSLFGQLALIMQTRAINLRNVFSIPLGPYPWALSGVMANTTRQVFYTCWNKALMQKKMNQSQS